MHREIVHGRKIPAIMISIIAITIALYIVEIVEITMGMPLKFYSLIDMLLLVAIICILFREFKQSNSTYKYSIIADKLIINKLNGKGDSILENIKMNDILFIGKKIDIPVELSKSKCHGRYLGSFISNKKCCCIYKKDGQLLKFIFEPSDKLVARVNEKIER